MKKARLGLRVSASLLKDAKSVARRQKVTLSVFIHRLLETAVEEDKKNRSIHATLDAEQI